MQKILVIRGGALGDFILTLPVIQTLKQNYPGAEVELIGHLPFLLLGKNYISRAHSLIHPRWSSLYLDTPLKQPLVEHLALFDMIISYIGDSTSIFNLHLKGIKGERFIHCNPNPPVLKTHMIEYLLTPLKSLKVKPARQPVIILDEKDKEYASKFFQQHHLQPEKLIAIHPGSGSRKKRWKLEWFIELSSLLNRGGEVIFILGEAEEDLKDTLREITLGSHTFSGLSLIQTAAILNSCSLYIGNDSGITHLAAALGVPTIAIFGPTNPQNWAPRGKTVHVLFSDRISCSPCSREERNRCSHQRCLEAVSTEEVVNTAAKILNFL